jgi:hypothetical protein
MVLGLREKEPSEFERKVSDDARIQYLDQTVLLVSLASLSQTPISFDDWWHRANLVNSEHAKKIMKKLVRLSYARKSHVEGKCWLALRDQGVAQLVELDTFLKRIDNNHKMNPAFARTEEDLI